MSTLVRGELNKEQTEALKALEKAFKMCNKTGLQLCGMDSSVYYASEKCLQNYAGYIKAEKASNYNGSYHDVAIVQNPVTRELENWAGEVNTSGAYKESGGW